MSQVNNTGIIRELLDRVAELSGAIAPHPGASLLGRVGGVSHPPKIFKNRGNSGKIRENSAKIMENSVTSGNICGC